MTTRTRVPASRFATLADSVLHGIADDIAEALRTDPWETIPAAFGLEVRAILPGQTSACGVAGRYFEDQQRITFDAAAVRGRQIFTLLHELGHHLAYTQDEVADVLEQLALEDAEEDFCDAFAAALILPTTLVEQHIGDAGPTAADVVSLYEASTASREASAVAAVQRMPGSGYVVIAGLDGTVQFAARTRTPYAIARNTHQSDSIFVDAVRTGRARTDSATLTYRSGHRTDPHEADAVVAGHYIFGVFTTGRPAWAGPLWIPPDTLPPMTQTACEACGHEWAAWGYGCPSCGDHRCPQCARCGCNPSLAVKEAVCTACGLLVRTERLKDGICNDCA